MTDHIFGELLNDWRHAASHLRHHGATITPNPGHTGATMSITSDLHDIKDALDQAAAWKTRADQALPGILTRLEHLEASPVVQALQAAVLTPEVEAAIAATVKAAAALTPQPQVQPQDQQADTTAAGSADGQPQAAQ